ncbi:MAG TPA: sigma-70 family RNA polymerase sigma factor, partial [Candidatus Kapabacteria bacterium]|nr:sigma-70 family RNA polymerase sigma factor [Candidatus Kapabacteria bacterium]
MKEEVLATKVQCTGTGRKVKESENINDFFWHFWQDYSRDLYRECLKMMKGSAEDAMDALETAMIFAHERFPRHAAEIYNLKGWLIRLTRNVCIDIHRKNKRESLYKENLYKVGGINERLTDEGPWSESIENTLEREEILNKVFISMKKLPERLREPAILRFFFKMKHREIAWHCNISDTNVRKRIQQAKNILLNDFQEFREDLDYFLLQGKNKRNNTFSSTLSEISRETEMILKRESQEINCVYTTSNLIRLTLPSGIEKSIIVFFDGNLNRQRVKIKTLQDYVKCFPGGWKKRLELAKLLYAGGNWEQSVIEFQKVLKKNPQSLEAWLYLADIHMGFEEEEKAVITLKAA